MYYLDPYAADKKHECSLRFFFQMDENFHNLISLKIFIYICSVLSQNSEPAEIRLNCCDSFFNISNFIQNKGLYNS